MFLIEYEKNKFINADYIEWIDIGREKVVFTVTGTEESSIKVNEEFRDSFLNSIQTENQNPISNVEKPCKTK